jgi:hypothetical protein
MKKRGKAGKISKRQKNWRSLDRQFSQIVSHAEQAPLDIHFFQSPEHESAELHIVFDIPENGFGLSATLLAQG